jgi:hypothetical protein
MRWRSPRRVTARVNTSHSSMAPPASNPGRARSVSAYARPSPTSICWHRRRYRSCFRPNLAGGRQHRVFRRRLDAPVGAGGCRHPPGGQRIMVVGAGRMHEPKTTGAAPTETGYPTLAQIAGPRLVEHLSGRAGGGHRTGAPHQPHDRPGAPEARGQSGLRPIDLLVISPSERIDAIAAQHVATCPAGAPPARRCRRHARQDRFPGRGAGQLPAVRANYTQDLMALGRADTLRQRGECAASSAGPIPARFRGMARSPLSSNAGAIRCACAETSASGSSRLKSTASAAAPAGPDSSAPTSDAPPTIRHHRPAICQWQIPHRPHHGIHPGRHLGAAPAHAGQSGGLRLR